MPLSVDQKIGVSFDALTGLSHRNCLGRLLSRQPHFGLPPSKDKILF
jgi:hypothetical protein